MRGIEHFLFSKDACVCAGMPHGKLGAKHCGEEAQCK